MQSGKISAPFSRIECTNRSIVLLLLVVLACGGCASPYYADRGAAFGGLTGAGVGALVGEASGNPAKGAVVGSAVGALTGAVVGNELDQINARNEAMIQQRLGRQVTGATTIDDAVGMCRAGLSDDVIIEHIRSHGMSRPLTASDLIALREQGVSNDVIRTMQGYATPARPVPAPRPASSVVVEEHYYAHPYPRPYWRTRHYLHAHRPRRGVSWGVSFGH